jgi:hypothetical protein
LPWEEYQLMKRENENDNGLKISADSEENTEDTEERNCQGKKNYG